MQTIKSFAHFKARVQRRLARVQGQTPLQNAERTISDLRNRPQMGEKIGPPFFYDVFSDLSEIPSLGPNPFDEERWIDTAEYRLRQLLLATQSSRFLVEHHLWPFITLVANLCVQREGVRILDCFGGGNFVQTFAVLPDELKSKCEYHIVDTPKNCEPGRELYKESESSPLFYSADPRYGAEYDENVHRNKYDIVMLCGTLQYIDNWRGLILELADVSAEYLYITRTPLNDNVPTFYTVQFIAPGLGPWTGKYIGAIGIAVINPGEIVELLSKKTYKTMISMPSADYQQAFEEFPDPYRQVFYSNMIFKKKR